MPLAIVEEIRAVIQTRLETLTAEVEAPTRFGGYRPQDLQVVLNQAGSVEIDELSYPGNPPAICHETTFNMRCRVMPSENNDTPKDKLVNALAANVRAAIRDGNAWYSFGGNAVDARFGDYELIEEGDGDIGVLIPLLVRYRFSEDDPTEVRA